MEDKEKVVTKVMYKLSLDLTKRATGISMLGMFVGENKSRQIQVSLYENGCPHNVPDTYSATIYVKKPEATAVSVNACTVTDNVISYDILGSDVDTPGIVDFQLKVIGPENEVLISCIFEAIVDGTIIDDTGAVSQPSYTALDAALSRVAQAQAVAEETLEKVAHIEDVFLEIQDLKEDVEDALSRETELLNTVDAAISEAQAQVLLCKAEVDNAKAEVVNAQNEVLNAQAEVVNCQNEVLNAKAEVDNAKAQVTLAQAEVVNAQAEVQNAKAEVDNAKAEVTKCEAVKALCESEKLAAAQSVLDCQAAIAEIGKKVAGTSFEIIDGNLYVNDESPYTWSINEKGNLIMEVSA